MSVKTSFINKKSESEWLEKEDLKILGRGIDRRPPSVVDSVRAALAEESRAELEPWPVFVAEPNIRTWTDYDVKAYLKDRKALDPSRRSRDSMLCRRQHVLKDRQSTVCPIDPEPTGLLHRLLTDLWLFVFDLSVFQCDCIVQASRRQASDRVSEIRIVDWSRSADVAH